MRNEFGSASCTQNDLKRYTTTVQFRQRRSPSELATPLPTPQDNLAFLH